MPVTVGPGQIDLSVSMATTTQTSGWSISYQLVFCGGPHLLSPSLSPTLSHTTHIHTHTHAHIHSLLPSASFLLLQSLTQCNVSPSLTHLLSRASPSSLLLLSPSCDFYPCFTILFVPRLPSKEKTDFENRRGESPLDSYDTILFDHFGVRFYNLL